MRRTLRRSSRAQPSGTRRPSAWCWHRSCTAGSTSSAVDYSTFLDKARAGEVTRVDIAEGTKSTKLTITAKDSSGHEHTFTTTGPSKLPDDDIRLLRGKGVKVKYHPQTSNPW